MQAFLDCSGAIFQAQSLFGRFCARNHGVAQLHAVGHAVDGGEFEPGVLGGNLLRDAQEGFEGAGHLAADEDAEHIVAIGLDALEHVANVLLRRLA